MPKPIIYGLVLAGGESRRMGQDKAMLTHAGRSQLEYMVETLTDVVDTVFVSTRAEQASDPARARFEQIVDQYENLGPLAGILSALERHPDVHWLVVACDLPNVDKATLQRLCEFRDTMHPFVAYSSSYDELPEPLCALYRIGCLPTIRQFVDEGMHCPRKILIRSDTKLLQQIDPHSLDNVNTPADLQASVLENAL